MVGGQPLLRGSNIVRMVAHVSHILKWEDTKLCWRYFAVGRFAKIAKSKDDRLDLGLVL
jgi:hypothetical protein